MLCQVCRVVRWREVLEARARIARMVRESVMAAAG